MPTYDYRCRDCGATFERVVPMAEYEAEQHCPDCSSTNVERIFTGFFAKTARKS